MGIGNLPNIQQIEKRLAVLEDAFKEHSHSGIVERFEKVEAMARALRNFLISLEQMED